MKDKIFDLIEKEKKRQEETLMMIPSENYTYPEVRAAVGSVLMHKYGEGYPGRRYYQGNEFVDQIEDLARERGKKLFGFPHINVQPYSGSPANAAVLMALVEPGETICGMKLASGGHLTHGHPSITFSGKFFRSVQYGVNDEGRIDYDEVLELVLAEKPKLVFAGITAYPFAVDFSQFREIADKVGAFLVADISHLAGLVAAGVHQSPVPFAHVVTSTTHKTLRGPRGAFIGVTKAGLEKDLDLAKKIDKAVFPGLQGGPHLHTIAGMAITFEKAASPEFKKYGKKVVQNAKVLSQELRRLGLNVYGSENHLMLLDVGEGLGKDMAVKLEEAGIIINYNLIPNDKGTAMKPSGIRLGTPALTTRGMGEAEMIEIAKLIKRVLDGEPRDEIKKEVRNLCRRFPVPGV